MNMKDWLHKNAKGIVIVPTEHFEKKDILIIGIIHMQYNNHLIFHKKTTKKILGMEVNLN